MIRRANRLLRDLEMLKNSLTTALVTVEDKITRELKDKTPTEVNNLKEQVEKFVDEDELKRTKTDIGKTLVKKIKERLEEYIDEDKLETAPDKLRGGWELDDDKAEG